MPKTIKTLFFLILSGYIVIKYYTLYIKNRKSVVTDIISGFLVLACCYCVSCVPSDNNNVVFVVGMNGSEKLIYLETQSMCEKWHPLGNSTQSGIPSLGPWEIFHERGYWRLSDSFSLGPKTFMSALSLLTSLTFQHDRNDLLRCPFFVDMQSSGAGKSTVTLSYISKTGRGYSVVSPFCI